MISSVRPNSYCSVYTIPADLFQENLEVTSVSEEPLSKPVTARLQWVNYSTSFESSTPRVSIFTIFKDAKKIFININLQRKILSYLQWYFIVRTLKNNQGLLAKFLAKQSKAKKLSKLVTHRLQWVNQHLLWKLYPWVSVFTISKDTKKIFIKMNMQKK